MNTKNGLVGSLSLVCRDKQGNIKWQEQVSDVLIKYPETQKEKGLRNIKKLITNTGMAEVAGLIGNTGSPTAFTVVGIGDSGTAESAAHTDLQASTNKKRKAGTVSRVTTTQTNDTLQIVATFSSADSISGTWSVQEAAVFNNTSGGVMLFRKIFSAKSCNWDAGDTLEVTAKCQVKQGS
ncbi:MAG: hypothetical protein NWE98_02140 [Candidatus Bathyarchaeota archaeon]|nr:hypothetical protein [Candidatus Bathyarchaeota archaeon]